MAGFWRLQDQQKACTITQPSAEELKQTGPAKNKRLWLQRHKVSSWQELP